MRAAQSARIGERRGPPAFAPVILLGRFTVANSNLPRDERPHLSATSQCGQQAEPSQRIARAGLDLSGLRATENNLVHPIPGRETRSASVSGTPRSETVHLGWRRCDTP